MADLLDLQDLYNESLVREILERTKRCAITWTYLGGTQFKCESIDTVPNPHNTWDFFLTKTQIGNLTYKYTLDIKKNGAAYISLLDGPLPYTGRDSVVQVLYQVVEILVLHSMQKSKKLFGL